MPRNNRKPEIVSALAKGGDPIKVADDFGVTRSYVYHLDKKRREGFGAIANNKTSADVKLPGGSLFKELSVSSLKRHGGDVDEEYLRELRGQQGVQLYKEMGNHPVIAAVLQAIKMTLRRVQWYAVPPKSGREEEVQFLNQCMEDMSHTFADYVDQILSMLQYGYAPFETVYKIRKGDARQPGPRISKSRFDDGKIGWRKFCLIGQDTLAPGNSWMFNDEDGSLKGCNQLPPVGTPFIRNRQWYISIPIEKMVLFRTTAEKNNPEGRALTLDTPVPTPSGWTTMGETSVGDSLYDEAGKIRYVIAKSEVWRNRPIYQINFSSGHSVLADENHQWSVTTFNDRSNKKSPRTLTTLEMFDLTNRDAKNPSLCAGYAPILDAPKLNLAVDPYVLGYWLGDGDTNSGRIGVHPADYESLKMNVEMAGFEISYDDKINAHVSGLKTLLRAIGVLGNKHIPEEYLRSSPDQRLALLQGMMDSDGSTAKGERDHASSFSNINPVIVQGFCELVRSLGGKPRARISSGAGESRGVISGREIFQRHDLYNVSFFLNKPIHRLERKLQYQCSSFSSRVKGHFIESIEPMGVADTVCIEVDSPSHLFLVGEGMVPTHNSVLRAMYPSWYYAKNLEEVEAISAERVGAGFPVVYLGDDISKSTSADSEINEYMKMVRNIRVDEQMGVVIPHPKMGAGMAREGTGVLFEFTAPPVRSGVQFGPIIERHEKRIAMVGLAQFIHLGMGQYGSQSLADVTTDFFQLAVSAWADSIRDTFNRFAVIPLLRLNSMDTRDPILIDHTNVSSPDLKTVADYINNTVGAKVIEPDDQLENSLRRIAALPDKDPTTTRLVMEEVDGDGGLRMDRSQRTKPANNQRNQNPKPDAPRPAEKPAARKPMRASEDTESDDFVGEQDMDTKQAMEFAERMQGKALDSLTKMAEMNKPQPPASITLAPTIQNYDVKEIAQAIRDIPAPKVTVSPTPVTVDVKPNVVNVAPAPVTFNVAQAPAAR